jgi:hypothetical protein
MLKGVGVESFYDQIIYLIIFGSILLVMGTIINKKKTQAS